MSTNTRKGAPTRQSQSAQHGQTATSRVPRGARTPIEQRREELRGIFFHGVAVGATAAALVFAVILWLWVIPTMDSAVAVAMEAIA